MAASFYAWTITKDHLFRPLIDPKSDEGICGPHDCKLTAEEIKKTGQYFKMYDDDGELYYEGYVTGSADMIGTEEYCFGPLEDFGTPNAGATEIKMRNPETGKMETV